MCFRPPYFFSLDIYVSLYFLIFSLSCFTLSSHVTTPPSLIQPLLASLPHFFLLPFYFFSFFSLAPQVSSCSNLFFVSIYFLFPFSFSPSLYFRLSPVFAHFVSHSHTSFSSVTSHTSNSPAPPPFLPFLSLFSFCSYLHSPLPTFLLCHLPSFLFSLVSSLSLPLPSPSYIPTPTPPFLSFLFSYVRPFLPSCLSLLLHPALPISPPTTSLPRPHAHGRAVSRHDI